MQQIDLSTYRWVIINSSAGKDSLVMLWWIVQEAKRQGYPLDRIVVVHADLGRVEWRGTVELAEQQAKRFGLRFEKMARPQGDLLDHVEARGKWPSSAARFCTSDHKRGQCAKIITQLTREASNTKRPAILNCMGFRSEESTARAKRKPFQVDQRLTNGKRRVDQWLPIHDWTKKDVWGTIKANDLPYHPAYDLGMPRLSCCFCIFAPKAALMIAGKANPKLLDTYCEVEEKIEHDFVKGMPIRSIRKAIQDGEKVEVVEDWNM
jgi:3'-phosphoadenosine 5'-phosphosulfate sulfotransferase (PAPS reductase)/FAD synthetase